MDLENGDIRAGFLHYQLRSYLFVITCYSACLCFVQPFHSHKARFTPPQDGIGWPIECQQISKFWSKRPDFRCLHAAKSAGHSRYPAVLTRISNVVVLTFVGASYPILWRREPGLNFRPVMMSTEPAVYPNALAMHVRFAS